MADDSVQNFVATAQAAVATHQQSVAKIISDGYEEHGQAEFDEMSNAVGAEIGMENMSNFGVALASTDAPVAITEYLASHPHEARSLRGMSVARASVALSRIQDKIKPSLASTNHEAIPAYKRSGPVEKRGLGDDVSDAQWRRNLSKSDLGRKWGF